MPFCLSAFIKGSILYNYYLIHSHSKIIPNYIFVEEGDESMITDSIISLPLFQSVYKSGIHYGIHLIDITNNINYMPTTFLANANLLFQGRTDTEVAFDKNEELPEEIALIKQLFFSNTNDDLLLLLNNIPNNMFVCKYTKFKYKSELVCIKENENEQHSGMA